MKRKATWTGAVIGLLVLAVFLMMGQKGSQGLFYRVSGGRNDMVILGSIHAGSREMYPMSKSIRQALKDADVLVFECDTESPEAIAGTQKLMYYRAGETLQDHISSDCFAAVERAAREINLDVSVLHSMKPWAVVSLLALNSMADENDVRSAQKASELGVETQVRRLGGAKPRDYLETAEEQLLLMDAFSPALQEYLLWDACSPSEDDNLQYWPKWWAEGDADAFAASYREGMKQESKPELAQEYHMSLITVRNRRMADRLVQMLESPQQQSFFVTVGLMHLVLEEDSILAELEKRGYTIEKITE